MTPVMATLLVDTVFGLLDRLAAVRNLKSQLQAGAISEDEAKKRVEAIQAKSWDEPIPDD